MSESADSKFSPAWVVCKNDEVFNLWADEVHCGPLPELLPAVDPEALPEPLLAMVKESKKIPKWIFDENSETYLQFKSLYRIDMPRFIARPDTNTEEPSDSTTSDLLFHALPHIVYIFNRYSQLWDPPHSQICGVSDLRQPIDRLTSHVWCEELGTDRFIFRSECRLKLPRTTAVRIQECTADSVAFFYSQSLPITYFSLRLRPGLVCTSLKPQFLEFVHWVTEYDQTNLAEVCRKVGFGMVSSLWQRRAIGRMNDFVFGTAHAEQSLTVYAARWEVVKPIERSAEPDDVSSPNLAAQPNQTTPDEPGSSKSTSIGPIGSQSRSASGKKAEITPSVINSQISDSRGQHQIKIYKIGEYITFDAVQIIEYYLLLRASIGIANGYLDEVLSDTGLAEKVEARAKAFGWAFPPKTDPRSSTNSGSHQDMESSSDEFDELGGRQVPPVADPEEEATWWKEWEEQAQRAVDEFGPGSLDELGSVEPDYSDRLSHYVNHV